MAQTPPPAAPPSGRKPRLHKVLRSARTTATIDDFEGDPTNINQIPQAGHASRSSRAHRSMPRSRRQIAAADVPAAARRSSRTWARRSSRDASSRIRMASMTGMTQPRPSLGMTGADAGPADDAGLRRDRAADAVRRRAARIYAFVVDETGHADRARLRPLREGVPRRGALGRVEDHAAPPGRDQVPAARRHRRRPDALPDGEGDPRARPGSPEHRRAARAPAKATAPASSRRRSATRSRTTS